ncbi:LppP/LprE family lipoprotein [Rhodococcus sp. H36-A4]|uniref:LppP/LprE family lipoprotein n=1 Tax=Rhodococcus sp. H36-A4 TaxID=3004353 RepID=UPI0022B04F58|nr:LppP/LprE family lipoprotein [Rhodococcus sp. H36-A4]MCZ4076732.1 LppP/LprE family lipoprotein [Rhodococcus sp. H36-A4]
MKRLLLVAISVMALVACGNSEDGKATPAPESSAAPGQQNVPQTVVPSPGALPPIIEDRPPGERTEGAPSVEAAPATRTPGSQYPVCLDLASTTVTDALASLLQYFDGVPWVATEIGDPCGSFTWVRADTSGGTASSPVQVLFFADGDYLGTGTSEPYAFTFVDSQSVDTITVGYRWLVGDDANANPSGGPALIRYQWDGSSVTMLDALPVEVTGS